MRCPVCDSPSPRACAGDRTEIVAECTCGQVYLVHRLTERVRALGCPPLSIRALERQLRLPHDDLRRALLGRAREIRTWARVLRALGMRLEVTRGR